jgi:cytochrome P450
MGHFPTVDEYIRFKWQIGTSKSSLEVVAWTMKQIRHHMDHHDSNNVRDFLSRFIQAREKYPEVVDEGRLADYTITNVIAGSDTTAIALREIIYQISTHPVTYNRLMAEIKSVLQKRTPDQLDKHITWTEGRDMVYLQACIKESLRYHPAICQILPRLVPEGGVELCDQFLPAGTVVGCNAFTIHRDRGVFGEDAEIWRPERWLDPDVERVRRMDNLHFAFGGGTRGCIGRNIAMLEVTKFVPEFFRTFDLHLVDPRQYRDHPVWIAPQSGLDAKLSMRDSTSGVGQFSRDRE